ncbi:MAG: Alanine racemase [Candidatus Roizmanbacteria bacterium GW2011_GWC2_37_13]|uniref:Alanine racemase n=1 Tax=Candidatus Roizmanbacteria bacterium GW2011_GWC2_37_13 TaxID=1618486 RepID=A0A0G0J8B4_9BACT|nr:MAG: Alanine racemase [Candidatus Roizmanbacteria bacterium GW2011_GWC1_37_12]KKQ24321.1 MAG: Alanine racemase [Candidatus Roizmanbacteria bacterium GW2011_GWC2_37_13]
MLFDKLKKLIGRRYFPLNRLEISQKKLIKNYKHLSAIDKKIKVAPVLKSNAYGHGIAEVAKVLDRLNPPFFCVDSLYEAYKLYKAGIKSRILIMGYVNPENLKVKNLPFSYVVYEIGQLNQILNYQPDAKIHIFVDTGMHREGILLKDLEEFLNDIPKRYFGNIEGLSSHFGASEKPNAYETKDQAKKFKKAVSILNKYGIFPRWKHFANSDGLINSKVLGLGSISNMARVGLGLYDSVLRFITHINQIKELKKGDKVGYDFTYTAKKDMTMAVLPVGYNDGVDRILSNRGEVLIKRVRCPIIGRVSMNITTVDVSKVKNVKVGDEVEIIFNPKINGRIPYEYMVHLNYEIKRVVVY